MRIGGLRLNLVFGKEMEGESLRDKREVLGREKGEEEILERRETKEKTKEGKGRFMRESSRKRRKGVDLGLKIFDFLKKRMGSYIQNSSTSSNHL